MIYLIEVDNLLLKMQPGLDSAKSIEYVIMVRCSSCQSFSLIRNERSQVHSVAFSTLA